MYKKQISRPNGNSKLPEYLTSFSPKSEVRCTVNQVEALKNGSYDLNEEEANLNKLRQAIIMNRKNVVQQIIPKLGLYALENKSINDAPKVNKVVAVSEVKPFAYEKYKTGAIVKSKCYRELFDTDVNLGTDVKRANNHRQQTNHFKD